MLGVDNMEAGVSGRESLNRVAEPGRDLLEIEVFDGTKSVRCHPSRIETADRTFTDFLQLFGPLLFYLPPEWAAPKTFFGRADRRKPAVMSHR